MTNMLTPAVVFRRFKKLFIRPDHRHCFLATGATLAKLEAAKVLADADHAVLEEIKAKYQARTVDVAGQAEMQHNLPELKLSAGFKICFTDKKPAPEGWTALVAHEGEPTFGEPFAAVPTAKADQDFLAAAAQRVQLIQQCDERASGYYESRTYGSWRFFSRQALQALGASKRAFGYGATYIAPGVVVLWSSPSQSTAQANSTPTFTPPDALPVTEDQAAFLAESARHAPARAAWILAGAPRKPSIGERVKASLGKWRKVTAA